MTERLVGVDHVEVWQETFTLDLLTLEPGGGSAPAAGPSSGTRSTAKRWPGPSKRSWPPAGQGRSIAKPPTPTWPRATGWPWPIVGGQLRDMEFVQFHPTVLYIAGGSRSLISEATRGAGAIWWTAMDIVSCPIRSRAGLLPATWSLCIVSQMEKTRHPNVYLDMTHLDSQRVLSASPASRPFVRSSISTYSRPHSPVARRPLHDGRGHRRSRGPHDLARPLGRRRSQV